MKHASLLKCIAVGYQPLHHCWKPTLEIVVLEYMVRWRFHFFKRIITIFGKAIQFDEWLNHQLESARKIVYPFWSLTKRLQNSCIFFRTKKHFKFETNNNGFNGFRAARSTWPLEQLLWTAPGSTPQKAWSLSGTRRSAGDWMVLSTQISALLLNTGWGTREIEDKIIYVRSLSRSQTESDVSVPGARIVTWSRVHVSLSLIMSYQTWTPGTASINGWGEAFLVRPACTP